mmetsp:Transcript_28780/g.66459  ORF Transcript_28780/g.66459 Transcript_28780/m.66459 type:complete len:249 (+) Transcript_28780:1155-1901(+)
MKESAEEAKMRDKEVLREPQSRRRDHTPAKIRGGLDRREVFVAFCEHRSQIGEVCGRHNVDDGRSCARSTHRVLEELPKVCRPVNLVTRKLGELRLVHCVVPSEGVGNQLRVDEGLSKSSFKPHCHNSLLPRSNGVEANQLEHPLYVFGVESQGHVGLGGVGGVQPIRQRKPTLIHLKLVLLAVLGVCTNSEIPQHIEPTTLQGSRNHNHLVPGGQVPHFIHQWQNRFRLELIGSANIHARLVKVTNF